MSYVSAIAAMKVCSIFNEDFKIHVLGTDLTLLTEIYDRDEKNLIKANFF